MRRELNCIKADIESFCREQQSKECSYYTDVSLQDNVSADEDLLRERLLSR